VDKVWAEHGARGRKRGVHGVAGGGGKDGIGREGGRRWLSWREIGLLGAWRLWRRIRRC
jgi:hypothetical protein